MTKYQIDKNLINSIQTDILDKRNTIVHEDKLSRINRVDIENYFELTEKYILALGSACKKSNIPYIDQANWVS